MAEDILPIRNVSETVLASTSAAIMVTDLADADHRIVYVNPAFTLLTGFKEAELLGCNPRLLQGPDTDLDVVREIHEAVAAGVSIRREILNYRKNGEPFWSDLAIDPIRDAEGSLVGFVGVQYDATAKHVARSAQVAAEARLQSIVSRVPGYIYRRVMQRDGSFELTYVSPSLNHFLGIPEGEAVTGRDFYGYVHPEDHAGLTQAVRQSAQDLSVFREEFRLVARDGKVRWFRSDAPARRLPNGDIVWDGLALDITAEKASATQLAFLAFHDSITGLSNRELFKNALFGELHSSCDSPGPVGVVLVDIDAFQEINDAFGLTVGDEVLRAVGRRLAEFVRGTRGTVARQGGDEFALLLPALPEGQSISGIAEAICEAVARPIQAGPHQIIVQACVGAASMSRAAAGPAANGDPVAEAMKQADLALRAAKRAGHGSHRLYTSDLDDRVHNQMALRQALPGALAQDQFILHYQPLVDLMSGRVVGAEALIRWRHPEFGLVRPDLFIPLAEVSGFIAPLGAWVIREAMGQSRAWRAQGIAPPRLAVNVSSVQLRRPGFVDLVRQAVADTGARPADFEFELTEGLLIEASSEILSILNELKIMGFGITIDDFGAGHATFKYLRDFPIDKIKIDKLFIQQLGVHASDTFIIRAIIALSRSLGIKVLAEGIETEAQLQFLRDEGCETGQGYLFSMPLPPEDLGRLLRLGQGLPVSGSWPEVQAHDAGRG